MDASGTTTYAWDFANRLSSVVLPTGTVTFKYDPLGRRIQKSSATGTTNYVYDESNGIEELDNGGNLLVRYAQSWNVDEPLSQLRSGATSYYQADGLGSITALSTPAGVLTNTYVYNSFGALTSSTDAAANTFKYTARELDLETTIYEYRMRYYDPAIGRFLSEDPIRFRGGVNFYSYTQNNPLTRTDPSGMCSGEECACERVNQKPIGGQCLYSCQCSDGGEPFVLMSYFLMVRKCGLSLRNPKTCPIAITVQQIQKNQKTGWGAGA